MADLTALHLEASKRLRRTSSTLKEREMILRRLPCKPEELTREIFDPWWIGRQMKANGELKAARSVATDLSHLKTFYKWALAERHIASDPVAHAKAPFQPKSRPRPTREPDLVQAIGKANPAMKAMLALGAMAGLRSSEIARIRWDDLDIQAGVMRVRHGKGNKDRSVPLSDDLLEALGASGSGLIVLTSTGKSMSPKAVSARIGRYLRSQGIDSTAHKLRARYATRFLAATGDLAATAEVLGHASVQTTTAYTIASSDTMRRGAAAAGRIG